MEVLIIIVKRGKIVGAHKFQNHLFVESYKSIRRRTEERIYVYANEGQPNRRTTFGSYSGINLQAGVGFKITFAFMQRFIFGGGLL